MYDIIGSVPVPSPLGLERGVPVWLRAVTTREGDDIVTRCCVVTQGDLFPIEVRVNLPALVAQARALGLIQDASVAGFGSFLKKAVKSITHNKIVKAVTGTVKKVVSNPVVQLANPIAAIAIHTTAKAATGRGTIKGAAGRVVDAGTAVATAAAGPAASAGALKFVSSKATAALGVGLKTAMSARLGGTVAAVAKTAAGQVALGKKAAAVVNAQKTPALKAAALSKVKPLIQRAVAVQKTVQKTAPALAKKVVVSSKVKASLASIAAKAKAGNADARLAAAVIARSNRALDEVARLRQQYAGGVPGLVITPGGRIVKAPRGKFTMTASTAPKGSQPSTLYRGPKDPPLKGVFSAVSGPSWGGYDDPGNQYEGPLGPITHPDGRVLLDDLGVDMDETGDFGELGENVSGAHKTRFDEPPKRWSAYVNRYGLHIGDEIKFGQDRSKRTGRIEGIDENGHLVVSTRRAGDRSQPENYLTVWRDQVTHVRVGSVQAPGWMTP